MLALIVVLRLGASPNQLAPMGSSLSPHPSDSDHGETRYYTHPPVGTNRGCRPARPPTLSLPLGNIHVPLEGCAFHSLSTLLHLVIDWFDSTTTYELYATKHH